jgi:hypothetical protein
MQTGKKKAALLRSSLALGCLGAGLLLAAGCWSSAPSVEGTIRVEGEPLPKGSIDFLPVEGTTGSGGGVAIQEGKYRIEKGLTVGKYRVEIQGTRRIPGKKVAHPLDFSLIDAEEAIVPPEYNRNSTLIREVGPGRNAFDFDLKRIRKGK